MVIDTLGWCHFLPVHGILNRLKLVSISERANRILVLTSWFLLVGAFCCWFPTTVSWPPELQSGGIGTVLWLLLGLQCSLVSLLPVSLWQWLPVGLEGFCFVTRLVPRQEGLALG